MDAPERELKEISNVLIKSVMIICLSVAFGFALSNCSVDASTIEQCTSACEATNSQMESVTAYKCICAPITPVKELPWVIK